MGRGGYRTGAPDALAASAGRSGSQQEEVREGTKTTEAEYVLITSSVTRFHSSSSAIPRRIASSLRGVNILGWQSIP